MTLNLNDTTTPKTFRMWREKKNKLTKTKMRIPKKGYERDKQGVLEHSNHFKWARKHQQIWGLLTLATMMALIIGCTGILPDSTNETKTYLPNALPHSDKRNPDAFCDLHEFGCPDGKGGESDEVALAEDFLSGSPMEGLGGQIVATAHEYGVSWRIIIGIAEAESNRGASYAYPYDHNCFNAWGIKPPGGRREDGSYLRCYYDWHSGITSIAALLSRRYAGQTPEEMCGVYVQPCSSHWLGTVNKYYHS